MTDPALTLAIRSMPAANLAMSMNWRNLLFLHYACPPEEIQAMLPKGLTVDTFPDESGAEMAWVGLVPFRMEAVKPRFVPFGFNFPETNVRTYCHVDGRDPGVWFFSLDAANFLACAFARMFFGLNYREATMTVRRYGNEVGYCSKRWKKPLAQTDLQCRLGEASGEAVPGTLEFFLIERYLLYSHRANRLWKGQVFHPPYRLQKVEEFSGSSGLIQVNGLVGRPFIHSVFSDGVDVQAGRVVLAGRP